MTGSATQGYPEFDQPPGRILLYKEPLAHLQTTIFKSLLYSVAKLKQVLPETSSFPQQSSAPSTTLSPRKHRQHVNMNNQKPMRTFAVERGHPVIAVWPALRDAIVSTLEERKFHLSTIQVFRRRRTLIPTDEDDTTVMLLGQWPDENVRQAIELIVREKCVALGQPNLRIEINEGEVGYF